MIRAASFQLQEEDKRVKKILFVCMGNICRSPLAEGVFRHYADQNLEGIQYQFDSAGTHDYHVGKKPDQRSRSIARQYGYDIDMLRARQVSKIDFEVFDMILAMDSQNLSVLQGICPSNHLYKLALFWKSTPHLATCLIHIMVAKKNFKTCFY